MKKTIAKFPKWMEAQLTKNFKLSEFKCRCKREDCSYTLLDLELVIKLQEIRDAIGPLKVTSGFRCEAHNEAVGGSPTSQHMEGTAADLIPSQGTIEALSDVASSIPMDGIGIYNRFVHVDTRGYRARWNNSKITLKKEDK